MPVFLLACAIVGTLLLGWGLIRLSKKSGKIEQFQKDKIKLLTYLKAKSIKFSKVSIMMNLEFSPEYLKKLIDSCEGDGLVTEFSEHIKLTTFGREYYHDNLFQV